ncbi:MAG: hypothetical protein Fur0036_17530 [Fimbriimonadaceae bacterium]
MSISRRELLKLAAGSATALSLSSLSFGQGITPLRIGIVGTHGKGESNRKAAAQFGTIAAICDVDHTRLAQAAADHPEAERFVDFRAMITDRSLNLDAVVVSTPDHTHAAAAALALARGLHVYCEKPLTRTIGEARRLAQLARANRCVTQMGNQGAAADNFRRAVNFVRDGGLGEIREVHCWTDRAKGWWPQGGPPSPPKRHPESLEWRLWLGPAPYRPFADGYHPFAWRGRRDFGTGALGDMGCHLMNLLWHSVDLRSPRTITAETGTFDADSFPTDAQVQFDYADFGLTWYESGRRPTPPAGLEIGGNGGLIVGSRDTLYFDDPYGAAPRLLSGNPIPDISFVKSPGHMKEWFDGMQGGDRPYSDIVHAGAPLTELLLLGNLAILTGKPTHMNGQIGRANLRGYEDLVNPARTPGWEI